MSEVFTSEQLPVDVLTREYLPVNVYSPASTCDERNKGVGHMEGCLIFRPGQPGGNRNAGVCRATRSKWLLLFFLSSYRLLELGHESLCVQAHNR